VYCITRAEVERTAAVLQEIGYSALPYHAGMSDEDRANNQDAFLTEQADTIVATVAFGMGIDKSNVRYVIHTGMPKSLEHYQQESGRAGRDGEKAECWLLYSGRDVMTWKRLLDQSTGEARDAALAALQKIDAYATSVTCRHASLIEHFGQKWTHGPCNACDVCLGKLELVDDALVVGQKILSCVLRVREKYGADYVSLVLTGSSDQRIVAAGHDKLSTWGILKEFRKQSVRQWIEQLVTQSYLAKDGEYNIVRVTEKGRRLLAGELTPTLLVPAKAGRPAAAAVDQDSWEGVDHGLFDALRQLRREEAVSRAVPAYIVFGDKTLRDLARQRPSTVERMLDVHGVGQQKAANFGQQFVECIVGYCSQQGLTMDVRPEKGLPKRPTSTTPSPPPPAAVKAFPLFDEGLSVEEVAQRLGRAMSTTFGYLDAYLRHRKVVDPVPWLATQEFEEIADAARRSGAERLKSLYEALDGRISYEHIRIAVVCLENRAAAQANATIK
jgi:ATP-dependent DNA helicase RecQ